MISCTHYNRNCSFISPCCNKIYGCRHCHDEIEGHIIEKSLDGINFDKIGEIPGSVTTNNIQYYLFNDFNPINGLNYYRLNLRQKKETILFL
jgi:uncharacterized CHY-type Zn-finger protein